MALSTPLRMGWIGLGSMGFAMATNLQKYLSKNQEPALRYWNRTAARGEPLRELGGIPCVDACAVAQDSDVIWMSLSTDPIVTSLIETLTHDPSLLAHKTLINTTTTSPALAATLTDLLATKNATYVAAPVFGATPQAASADLLVALGGPQPAIARLTPYLASLSRNVVFTGQEPRSALALKACGNYLTAGLFQLLSETHVLAEQSGVPEATLQRLVELNYGDYVHGVSRRLSGGAYYPPKGEAPRSGLELGIKDVGIGVNMMDKGVLRVGEAYLEAAGEALDWGDKHDRKLDSSSVYGVVRKRAGLPFETDLVQARDAKDVDT